MDAKRLEGLAQLCDDAIADTSSGFGAYFDSQDIADLARCAAAWATVERKRYDLSEVDDVWYFRHYDGPTAIEAVEAAREVKT